ncbi:unnamed protein product [Mytilus coruscus]|uniref:Integrase zinc-binding domain-containing protein n=1 Tax=Mytilus coruscus TaxID=42192 RepID=A0A6J8ASE1_MYTCO|nr:unnamed protein product [Mytilus coruscus]
MKFLSDALVSKLGVDGIIGLDFLLKHRGIVNVPDKTLNLSEETLPSFIQGRLGCYRVSVSERIEIPPRPEVICNGIVDVDQNGEIGYFDAIVEPSEKIFNKRITTVARTLVKFADQVPIRLMNVTNEVRQIYKHTVVGQLSPVEITVDQDAHANHKTEPKLPATVQKLYNETTGNLDTNQSQTIYQLLNIMYRRWNDGLRTKRQAIIPWSEGRNVLMMCHDSKISCHLGIKKTLARVRQSFYRPGLDVHQYVLGCDFCMRRKKPRKAKKNAIAD